MCRPKLPGICLFIHLQGLETGFKKKKHLCVARGLGEVTAEIRV